MKRLSLLFLTACLFIVTQAQYFTDFGQVHYNELKITQCPFDNEAEAIVFVDEAYSNYNDDYNLITYRRIRLKILKENGIEHANISIPFFNEDNFESIDDIEGIVINDQNGSPLIQSLDRKSIYRKKVTNFYSEVRFTFPNVKPGSIVEYKYRSTMKHYGGLRNWYFQREIPVVVSKYDLVIIPNHEFAYRIQKSSLLDISIKSDPKAGQVSFEMQNIPGLTNEPFMDSRKDYLQLVYFQLSGYGGAGIDKKKYMTSWDEVTRELISKSSFGGQLGKDIPVNEEFIKLVKSNPSDIEKIKLMYDYVRNNLTWNGFYGLEAQDGLKSVWNKKTGTNGEINLLLVNLLKAVGLEAHPMLVSERHHGKVNVEYPFTDQFNSVLAVVITEKKKYFLDATDKSGIPGIIPSDVLNTTGFIVNRKSGGIVTITDDEVKYKDNISVMATVNPDATLSGDAYVSSQDYARIKRLEEYKSNNEKYIDNNFRKATDGMVVENFSIANENNDSLALTQQFKFNTQLNQTGEYLFLPVILFSGFEKNPFISKNRFSNINFGYKQAIGVNSFFEIPESYKPDALPKGIQLTNVNKTIFFSRQVLFDEQSRKIVSRIRIEFHKSLYEIEEYPEIKEFYKKMFDFLNEKIVLKKK